VKFSVCFVTAEMAPHAKAGGLADVSAALTRVLHERGHRVLAFLPLYADLERHGLRLEPVEGLDGLSLDFGPHRFDYAIRRGRRAAGLPDLMLVDCPALFGRPGLYGSGADEHLRFLLLSRAALEACRLLGVAPDVVHCHDWHTALLPLYLRTVYAQEPLFAATRSILTIHNLGYQGVLPASAAAELGLGGHVASLDADEAAAGRINLLRQGIRDASLVSTVSPTYAREICTPAQGMGLDGTLRARGDAIVGILNGVDTDAWDPARDACLPFHFSAGDLSGKARMREALCARLGLEADVSRPLVGMVTRLVWQKGVDLLFEVLPDVLGRRELSLAVLGGGDPEYERVLAALAEAHPGLMAYRGGQDEELAHWIEAGADAFLMPSRYEPCGLNQMYSMRYGTVPIVRRTGGLADSVEHYDPLTGRGTGIVFEDADAGAIRWALGHMRALHADPSAWSHMVANGMAQDFSWDAAAGSYLGLYARAASLPR
jgi:starch synthase